MHGWVMERERIVQGLSRWAHPRLDSFRPSCGANRHCYCQVSATKDATRTIIDSGSPLPVRQECFRFADVQHKEWLNDMRAHGGMQNVGRPP